MPKSPSLGIALIDEHLHRAGALFYSYKHSNKGIGIILIAKEISLFDFRLLFRPLLGHFHSAVFGILVIFNLLLKVFLFDCYLTKKYVLCHR